MLLAEQRRLLCEYGRRAAEAGLVIGTSGNLSVRVGELVAVTPGGIALDHLEPESCPVIDVEGHLVDGELRPSSETPMHLAVYAAGGAAGRPATAGSPSATTCPRPSRRPGCWSGSARSTYGPGPSPNPGCSPPKSSPRWRCEP